MIMTNNESREQMQSNDTRQRKRSVFDFEQIRHLEHVFNQITHYPDLSLRQHLTLRTQLPDKKIQVYYLDILSIGSLDLVFLFCSNLDLVSKSPC